jgi:hypothetical protein
LLVRWLQERWCEETAARHLHGGQALRCSSCTCCEQKLLHVRQCGDEGAREERASEPLDQVRAIDEGTVPRARPRLRLMTLSGECGRPAPWPPRIVTPPGMAAARAISAREMGFWCSAAW